MRARPVFADDLVRSRRPKPVNLRIGVTVATLVLALALHVFLPLHIPLAGLIDLPLLAVVYIATARRHILIGMLVGCLTGLAQDSLTHGPIGLFGIIKAVIGYSVASASLYIETDYAATRSLLAALSFLAQQVLFWVLEGALLGGVMALEPAQTLILSAMHAGLALLLFRFLDKVKMAT